MSYDNSRLYSAAKLLTQLVRQLTEDLPERFAAAVQHALKTVGQIEDAIAEGYGQRTPGLTIYHFGIGRSSADEARSQLTRLADDGAFSHEKAKRACILTRTIAKMFTAAIESAEKRKNE